MAKSLVSFFDGVEYYNAYFLPRDAMNLQYTSDEPVSVRPSVTSRCSTKTAKRAITQTTPHDRTGTLVF